MKNYFENTQLRTEDFGDMTSDFDDYQRGPGYTTEEYDDEFPEGTGKQNKFYSDNVIDLTDE